MATYYVSPNGSDSNNGLGPDASHSTNKPFLTIAKCIGTSGVAASGDTIHIAPGTYNEAFLVGVTPTSELIIAGDPWNAQGFKDGSGVLLQPKEVIWTAWTSGYLSLPSATNCVSTNSKDWLTFRNIWFIGGKATADVVTITSGSENITFSDCFIFSGNNSHYSFRITVAAGVTSNIVLQRCVIASMRTYAVLDITLSNHTSDYNAGITVEESVLWTPGGTQAVTITNANTSGGTGGGVTFTGCTVMGPYGIRTTGTAANPTYKVNVYDTLLIAGFYNLYQSGSGSTYHFVEDGNVFLGGGTARNGTMNAGSNTRIAGSGDSTLGSLWIPFLYDLYGLRPGKRFLEPYELLGYAAAAKRVASSIPTAALNGRQIPSGCRTTNTSVASAAQCNGTQSSTTVQNTGASWTTNQFAGQICRLTSGTGSGQWRLIASNTSNTLTITPAWVTTPVTADTNYEIIAPGSTGCGCIGALEVHDTARQETSTVDASGSAIAIDGPGDHDFEIPVDAESTSISIKMRFDSNYGTTVGKPQAILLTNGQIGFAGETKTMTEVAGNWETLTFTSFTPAAKGIVRLRILSRDSNGYGKVFADTAA